MKKTKKQTSDKNISQLSFLSQGIKAIGCEHLFFLGILAYPNLKEAHHLKDFIKAVISEKAKGLVESGGINKIQVANYYKKYERRKALRSIQHVFDKRLPRRMQAVVIALNRLNKWEMSLNKSISHLLERINNMAESEEGNWLGNDSGNVYRLIWKESMPVLHMAFALYPFIHNIFHDNEEPDFLTLSVLDALKEKGVKELEKELKKEIGIPIRDLFLLSNKIRIKEQIKDAIDLIAVRTWLPDILKIAEAWSFLLPQMIPSIKKQDLYKI